MPRTTRTQDRRRGIVVVKVALLLTVLLIFLAFAIDVGVIALTKSELQRAADAAALAAADELLDRAELTGRPDQSNEIAAARLKARATSLSNVAGRRALDLNPNTQNAADGDIVVGHVADPADLNSPLATTPSPTGLPATPLLVYVPPVTTPPLPVVNPPSRRDYRAFNSVRVTPQRSDRGNTSLAMTFGRAAGVDAIGLSATATATFEDNIKGFRIDSDGVQSCKLLPFALDVNTFAAAAAGNSTVDLYIYDPEGPATPPQPNAIPPERPDYRSRVSFCHPNIEPNRLASILNNPKMLPTVTYGVGQFVLNQAFRLNELQNPQQFLADLFPGDGVKEALLVPLALQTQVPLLGQLFPQLVPGGTISVGNFGTLFIGSGYEPGHDTIVRQILYGPNRDDFAQMGGSLELGANGTLRMRGNTVIAATLKETLQAIRGQPRVIPLFRPTPQGVLPQVLGTTVEYTIVGFAGIVVLEVLDIPERIGLPAVVNPLTGQVLVPALPAGPKTLRLLIQPEFVIDASAIGGGTALDNGGARTSQFVYRPLRLSR